MTTVQKYFVITVRTIKIKIIELTKIEMNLNNKI